ncbi:adenylyltransferase/cytidyltransferase family protein [Candidatus Altiarchaeota archaeon]
MSDKSIVVVATGVFEVIHPGHILFLEEARKLGDSLVVIVARDKNVATWKRKTHIPEEQRRRVVEALKPVDQAILGEEEPDKFYQPILQIKPEIIAIGPNQEISIPKVQEKINELGLKTKIVRVNSYWANPLASTRRIIQKIRETK